MTMTNHKIVQQNIASSRYCLFICMAFWYDNVFVKITCLKCMKIFLHILHSSAVPFLENILFKNFKKETCQLLIFLLCFSQRDTFTLGSFTSDTKQVCSTKEKSHHRMQVAKNKYCSHRGGSVKSGVKMMLGGCKFHSHGTWEVLICKHGEMGGTI